MNLKYVTEFGDIMTAYVLGCLEERVSLKIKQTGHPCPSIIYPVHELQERTDCSFLKCVEILDRLERYGYLERKHDLAGPDQFYLVKFMTAEE